MGKFDESLSSGNHYKLNQIAGEWEGVTRVYFDESGSPVDESKCQGTIRPILGGRFMLHEYTGAMGGRALEGIAIFGYHIDTGKFQSALIDSFHTGTSILFSEDTQSDKLFSALGSYAAGEEHWGWRTEIEMPDNDQLIIKATNLTPQGEPAGGVTTVYQRRK